MHENVVNFLASFRNKGQYWFVTRYYPMGSVYDFLEVSGMETERRERQILVLPIS